MKLIKPTDDKHFFLSKVEMRKLLVSSSILIVLVYVVASVCSLLGLKTFIYDYSNPHTDAIYTFLIEHKMYSFVDWGFSTLEFIIISWFLLKHAPKWYYVLPFYAIVVIFSYISPLPYIFYALYPFVFYVIMFLVDKHKTNNTFFHYCIRLIIAIALSFIFQFLINIFKTGIITLENREVSFTEMLIYALEYDVALSIVLYSISLELDREKGEEQLCMMSQAVGGFSQTSKKQSLKLRWKNLSTKTKNKILLLYIRVYATQILGIFLIFILPFVFGKALELLIMYLCFAIARSILGFNYSLHFAKETSCLIVGIVIFGFLSLIVPSITINLIMSLVYGIGLAILLHLSYKYKALAMFYYKVSRDRFAELYVYFNGNFEEGYVKKMSLHYGLNELQIQVITLYYCQGNKLSYIAKHLNYSLIYVNKVLDSGIEIIKEKI